MARVYITQNDPFVEKVYTDIQVLAMFGQDFLDDYGVEIPDELLERYLKSYDEFWDIQFKILALKNQR